MQAINRIQKFDNSGNYLTQWGSSGQGPTQFFLPNGLAVDASGNTYVTGFGPILKKFTGNGSYLTQWNITGAGNGMATDPNGNVYVASYSNNHIQKFSSNGELLTQWGSTGNGNGQFSNPTGVAVDESGNIYVVDQSNNRIQKFKPAPLGAPLDVIASAGPGRASISFKPPLADGGSKILSYTVTSTPDNITASGASSPIIITGLTDGTTYSFNVYATNASGAGPVSVSSNSVTTTGPYSVTAFISRGNGTISSPNPLVVASGGTSTFTVNPSSDYSLSTTVNGTCPAGTWNGNSYTTGTIIGDCTVGFLFNPALNITISGRGSVLLSTGGSCTANCSQYLNVDSLVTLTPLATNGFMFGSWSGACSGSPCILSMTEPKNVTASFGCAVKTMYINLLPSPQPYCGGAGDICTIVPDQGSICLPSSFESININCPKLISIGGGCDDPSVTTPPPGGTTTINGSLTISDGTVNVNGIEIR
ncbi:E3 ubiquitin-protein ligase TRIM71 [Geobacter sp. OR-1]|nr:E3 ubiquitin-protein ligase TRIM71 [Geobacter sp. OR-1]